MTKPTHIGNNNGTARGVAVCVVETLDLGGRDERIVYVDILDDDARKMVAPAGVFASLFRAL